MSKNISHVTYYTTYALLTQNKHKGFIFLFVKFVWLLFQCQKVDFCAILNPQMWARTVLKSLCQYLPCFFLVFISFLFISNAVSVKWGT